MGKLNCKIREGRFLRKIKLKKDRRKKGETDQSTLLKNKKLSFNINKKLIVDECHCNCDLIVYCKI